MDLLKKLIVYILLSCVMIAFGALIGYQLTPDSKGIFVHLYNPFESGQQPLLIIGEPQVRIPDLEKLDEAQTLILIQNIGKLKRDTLFAELLRDLRDKQDPNGPFATKDHSVTVKFSDDDRLNGVLASTCKDNRQLFGREFSLLTKKSGRAQSCETLINTPSIDCLDSSQHIWISKKTGKEWLKIEGQNELPTEIKVTARELHKIL
jgi:hypothetical protein